MALIVGSRVGPYQITGSLGAGGMGEVYRARDTRLKREVALKILPESFATDPDRLARFQREAEVLASLNHTNIAQIFGFEESDGTRALVMELVEGPTLADRIAQGPLPVDEALPIARQIAEALEAAHEQGIIHRDLKPANIKLRPDGTVKVLDFGLAKLNDPNASNVPNNPNVTNSPTITSPALMTGVGMLLGTAAYMSPEQARGKAVDKRADIWAFGCVLYETLSGKRVFDGADTTDVIAAIVRAEPDWAALPAATPRLRTLLKRCLHKDVKQRLRDIGDARIELDEVLHTAPTKPDIELHVAGRRVLSRRALPAAAGALVIAVLGGYAGWQMRPVPMRPLARFVIPIARDASIDLGSARHAVAVSPRGTHVAYAATGQVYVRAVDQLDAQPIRSISGGVSISPFFSPDGEWLGFFQGGQLKRVSVNGGAPVAICAAENPFGVSWNQDDFIVFGQGSKGIMRVPAGGGSPELLVKMEAGESAHGPQMLPGGRAVLFTLRPEVGRAWDDARIVVQSLDTGARKVLIEGGRDARYISTGHVVYALQTSLLAVKFNAGTLEVEGPPVTVIEGVARSVGELTGAAHFSFSRDGTLVYVPDTGSTFNVQRHLTWVDRQGREELIKAPLRAYRYPRLSPDGQRVAIDIQDEQFDIWVWDLAGETLTRLTLEPSQESYPVWTPDSRRVIFNSDRAGLLNLFSQPADGTGSAERLIESPNQLSAMAISPDGAALVIREQPPGGGDFDLMLLSLTGERRLRPLVNTSFHELNGEISPDGRWLAYQSTESGRGEIYVRSFPEADAGRWQVSSGGGTRPLWARNGEELFYVTLEGDALMRVPISGRSTFKAGNPEQFLDTRAYYLPPAPFGIGAVPGRMYDISPDGRRFLMIKPQNRSRDEAAAPPALVVVQGWFEELKRLVPTN